MQENGIDEIGILKLDIEYMEKKAIFEHDPHPWLSKTAASSLNCTTRFSLELQRFSSGKWPGMTGLLTSRVRISSVLDPDSADHEYLIDLRRFLTLEYPVPDFKQNRPARLIQVAYRIISALISLGACTFVFRSQRSNHKYVSRTFGPSVHDS